jgi:anthranilate/para-aminobenzoate synthase component I
MDCGAFKIISNSPERLLKVEDGIVETQPIKGTRPRGSTDEEDRRFMEELKNSTKERAEHVMVVDLERNDLGRVSIPGSIEVRDFEKIETYPVLHHMVSTVRGRLKPGMDGPMALRASFPGGSVTGAPKIRAMEIIDELEPNLRGIYTGGVGFIDFNGSMDISMAIRTALYKDGRLHLNVGGGIVADSVPEDEYEETILKARDFLEAGAWLLS